MFLTFLLATTTASPAFADDRSIGGMKAIALMFEEATAAMQVRNDELVASVQAGSEEPNAFVDAPVGDDDLSKMRGGFALPGGLEVSVAVQTDTRVNGLLMLRSVFVVDKSAPTLTVYGRTDGSTGSATNPTGTGSTTSVTLLNQPVALGGASDGLTKLGVADGGTAAASGGTVRVDKLGAGSAVILSQPTLDVSHLAGQAYGSVIANRGNDVSIDTVTNINIDLKNSMPSNIGSTMFRVDTLALESAARLGR